MDATIIADNEAQRARLAALVAWLSDAGLARPLGGGWTVATALAHLAFWDRHAKLVLDNWERGHVQPLEHEVYSDLLNVGLMDEWAALPPREAARLALEAAAAVNERVASLDARVADEAIARGEPWRVRRHQHRAEHIDQIEQALGGGSR